jgi:hypothetical protein
MVRSFSLRKLRKYIPALPALVFGFIASPATSALITIDGTSITAGAHDQQFLGASITSQGGNFTKVTADGTSTTVIGVSTGFVANEIDIDNESITINFSPLGATITQITLGLMYLQGEWGGASDEAARLITNSGAPSCSLGAASACILSAAGVWAGSTSNVTQLSAPIEGQGGIFQIRDPFGGNLITSLQFSPFSIAGVGGGNSDFGIVSITYNTTAVPEPDTLLMVGIGIIGFALARRVRTTS